MLHILGILLTNTNVAGHGNTVEALLSGHLWEAKKVCYVT